ncbi:hypothetical protein L1887_61965 [Cichorium endivia]|nr:hypothetical protein L1887_61965 [Cichorium endivia]
MAPACRKKQWARQQIHRVKRGWADARRRCVVEAANQRRRRDARNAPSIIAQSCRNTRSDQHPECTVQTSNQIRRRYNVPDDELAARMHLGITVEPGAGEEAVDRLRREWLTGTDRQRPKLKYRLSRRPAQCRSTLATHMRRQ